MLLGHVIRDLVDEAKAAEALIALNDLPLLARLDAAAGPSGAGAYAAAAVARFADQADDEDWLSVMNALERASDPAAACLRTMIGWALKQDAPASGCGSCAGAHAHA